MVIFLRDADCFLTICLSLVCLHLRYVCSGLLCTFCLTFFLKTSTFNTFRDLLHVRCSAFKYFLLLCGLFHSDHCLFYCTVTFQFGIITLPSFVFCVLLGPCLKVLWISFGELFLYRFLSIQFLVLSKMFTLIYNVQRSITLYKCHCLQD